MSSPLEIRGRIHDLVMPLERDVWEQVALAISELERLNVALGHRQAIDFIERHQASTTHWTGAVVAAREHFAVEAPHSSRTQREDES